MKLFLKNNNSQRQITKEEGITWALAQTTNEEGKND